MEGIAPLGALDPQHAIAQFAKALADPARALAFAGPPPGAAIEQGLLDVLGGL